MSQTLMLLDLTTNKIDDQGVNYLAELLQTNEVRFY